MGLFNRKHKTEERSFFPETSAVYGSLIFRGEQNPTVSRCVDKISNTLSTLPITLYSYTKSGKKLAVGHPLFFALEDPAVEETPTMFYGQLVRHIVLKGNAYLHINRDSKGDIVGFSLINPDDVFVSRSDRNRKLFHIKGKVYTEYEILHIPFNGTGYNGTLGVSPVEVHKELIALDDSLLVYINTYFNNTLGSRYSLELGSSYPSRPADLDKLYASIIPVLNKYVTGANNAGKMMIPPPDSKMTKIEQASNVQAQLDSLLDFIESKIAEGFNVPYEVINSKASKYNSLEAKQRDFLDNCIFPLGNHICQSFEKLLKPTERNLFVSIDYKHMLSTDLKSTIEYLRQEVQSGLLSVNEARSKLGLDDIGSEGDYYWMPANLIPMTEDNIQAILAKSKLALIQAKETEVEMVDEHSKAGDDLQ
jgi:HK97 family phage portal protein